MNNFNLAIYGAVAEQVHSDILSLASTIVYEVYDSEKMLEPLSIKPEVILCYNPPTGCSISPSEAAQTLRCTYPETPIFFIATDKKDFEKKRLIKNGFTQAYLIPWEKADLLRSMSQEHLYTIFPELKSYRPVKIIDLVPGAVLEFSLKVFLPMNNKFLPFSEAGSPISDEKLQKLLQSNFNKLFIRNEDYEKFEAYTSTVLKKLLAPGCLSETERTEKLETCIRDLISDMFVSDVKESTFGKAQGLLDEVKNIINIMIKDSNPDVLGKIENLVNQEKNFYLHLSNVSTYAGLFAMTLGYEKPEIVALAGLLHDIGKINLPPEIADLNRSELSNLGPHGIEGYKSHPNFSSDIIKLKRMVLPKEVVNGILHHHEAMNGSGFPSGLTGHRISLEGRIVAIANEFDELTTTQSGRKNVSPREALETLVDENSKDPGRMILDLDLLLKLQKKLIG